MKTIIWICLIVAIVTAALLLTRAIVQSDLPVWLKIFLLR